jgi:DNA-binding NarL/FixJ family response regulator
MGPCHIGGASGAGKLVARTGEAGLPVRLEVTGNQVPVRSRVDLTAYRVGQEALTFDLDEYVYAALAAGASGFLLKDVPPERLVAAVRQVRDGDVLLAPEITRRLVARYAAASSRADRLAPLTDRERGVLELIARGLSNVEIAAAHYLGEATVKTHVGRILAKLELRDRTQAVIAAYKAGLVRPSP